MKAAGWKQAAVWLSPEATENLELLCKERGMTRQELINRLLLESALPAKKKKTRKKKPTAKKKAAASKKKTTAKKQPRKSKSTKGGNCHLCGQWRPDKELDELVRGPNRYNQAQCKDFTDCAIKRRIVKGG